jgi:sugar-specific transcriptional regulator TrmB
MNEIEKILVKIGLTSQESKVYLALLTLQEAKTGVLCKETGIASSNIYTILDKLLEKGLASYRVHNNIKKFSISPSRNFNLPF